MKKTCCVTGNRPQGFKWDYYDFDSAQYRKYIERMEQLIVNLIEKEGYENFIAGGAMGVDTDFAETVIRLREKKYSFITLQLVLPYNGHHVSFSNTDKERFYNIKNKANEVQFLSKGYTKSAFHIRNRYMVDNASFVLAFWNGINKGGTYYTINYAKRLEKHITVSEI